MRDAPAAAPAVELNRVFKTYRLYRNPRARALDQLGLAKLLGGGASDVVEFDALRGVSLNVAKGERLGIVGRNGAGKTTLLKLIIGNFAPTRGRVTVHGSVQALMQVGLGFHPSFTGRENARSSLLYNGLSGAELDAAVEEIIEFCELGEFLDQPTGTYSSGMRMRLQFATATAIRPEILVIDEVMGAGDAYFAAKSAHRMKSLTQSGCTLLLVSHSPYQVLEFCDRAIWLDEGAIRMQGEAHDVMGAYEVFIEQLGFASSSKHQFDGPDQSERSHGAALLVQLADGRSTYRLPGKRGIKVHRIRVTDGSTEIERTHAHGHVVIDIDLLVEETGRYSCYYLVTLWSDRMRRVARAECDVEVFEAVTGDIRRVNADLSPFLLNHGTYYVSFSIYDRSGHTQSGRETRFDMLSRCLSLAVDAAPSPRMPLYEHPSRWETVSDGR